MHDLITLANACKHATCCRCLADEADANAHAHLVPPPVTALREFSVKLQTELQEVHTALLLLILPINLLYVGQKYIAASLVVNVSVLTTVLCIHRHQERELPVQLQAFNAWQPCSASLRLHDAHCCIHTTLFWRLFCCTQTFSR